MTVRVVASSLLIWTLRLGCLEMPGEMMRYTAIVIAIAVAGLSGWILTKTHSNNQPTVQIQQKQRELITTRIQKRDEKLKVFMRNDLKLSQEEISKFFEFRSQFSKRLLEIARMRTPQGRIEFSKITVEHEQAFIHLLGRKNMDLIKWQINGARDRGISFEQWQNSSPSRASEVVAVNPSNVVAAISPIRGGATKSKKNQAELKNMGNGSRRTPTSVKSVKR
jgi:hypothetical protein